MGIRLVVFDLDGTLIRGRTICEVVADGLGHRDRMRVLEGERDLPMLDVVGLPIFVGTARIDGLPPRTVHPPDADILEVARVVLA